MFQFDFGDFILRKSRNEILPNDMYANFEKYLSNYK